MKRTVKAKKDDNFSNPKNNHYVVGHIGDSIVGGLYLDKKLYDFKYLKVTIEEWRKEDDS